MSFQTETRQILDLVTHSLYTDKEIFLRELISNASDALEKARYLQSTNAALTNPDLPFDIHIDLDPTARTLTLRDHGVGMTEDELISNLGTIARSGSKAFIQELKDKGQAADLSGIIGKFGVGFYSTFMVADKVEVYTQSAAHPGQGRYWVSDGTGAYEVSEVQGVERGTKVVVHFKADVAGDFTSAHTVEGIVKKYSNFVGFPIHLNGKRVNTQGALWLQPKDSISEEQHTEFYRYYGNAYDTPLYRLHFTVDAPIALHALLYFPSRHLEKYGMGRLEPGVSLYSRKVLIQAKSKLVLPEWLRFIKGVVDSEDIPLNISRETMQDSRLMKRISTILTKRTLRFLHDESVKQPKKFIEFYLEYSNFLKEGACTDFEHRKEIAGLLRFDSSLGPKAVHAAKDHFAAPGDEEAKDRTLVSFDDYVSRMGPNQTAIYFLSAPSRSFALSSPYYESFAAKGVEVLFCYSAIDEFVMRNLEEFNGRKIVAVDSAEAADVKGAVEEVKVDEGAGREADDATLLRFIERALEGKVSEVKASTRLTSSPALIVNTESAAMRKMMKFVEQEGVAGELGKQKLEVNTQHPIMRGVLGKVKEGGEDGERVARLVMEQVFDNACVMADLMDNPRVMMSRLNELMMQALGTGKKTGPADATVAEKATESTTKNAESSA